jgi:hypothetical protein
VAEQYNKTVAEQLSSGVEVGVALPSPADPMGEVRRDLASQLIEEAQGRGVSLVGPGGLLAAITKQVLETGLEVEMEEHLGYEKHAVEGRDGGNSRNGVRTKTVLTEIGPVELDVPRDRDGTFEPTTVRKRQRSAGRCRLDGDLLDGQRAHDRGDLRVSRRGLRR